MSTQSGSRAAHVQSMVTGRKWSKEPNKRTSVWLSPGLLDMAEQSGIISRYGRNGGQSFSDWVQDRLIDAIREKQDKKKKLEESKKLIG